MGIDEDMDWLDRRMITLNIQLATKNNYSNGQKYVCTWLFLRVRFIFNPSTIFFVAMV